MPFATFMAPVKAPIPTIWEMLLDKVENPSKYVPGVSKTEILERGAGWVVRRMQTDAFEVTERINIDLERLEIVFALIEHPRYTGMVVNRIWPGDDDPELMYTLNW